MGTENLLGVLTEGKYLPSAVLVCTTCGNQLFVNLAVLRLGDIGTSDRNAPLVVITTSLRPLLSAPTITPPPLPLITTVTLQRSVKEAKSVNDFGGSIGGKQRHSRDYTSGSSRNVEERPSWVKMTDRTLWNLTSRYIDARKKADPSGILPALGVALPCLNAAVAGVGSGTERIFNISPQQWTGIDSAFAGVLERFRIEADHLPVMCGHRTATGTGRDGMRRDRAALVERRRMNDNSPDSLHQSCGG